MSDVSTVMSSILNVSVLPTASNPNIPTSPLLKVSVANTADVFVDTVVIAVGTRANPICPKSISGLKLNKWGYIETNENCQTNIENIFAGGDIVTGSATVISAMGAGKRATKGIHEYLTKKYTLSIVPPLMIKK